MATVTALNKNPEYFEVFTDAFNQTYIYSKTTGATAYFINNGTAFYFTTFYGDQNSLLYYFYLAAYKVVFTTNADITVTDVYPLQLTTDKPALWLRGYAGTVLPIHKITVYKFRGSKWRRGCNTRDTA
ncbi:hypothetical protein HK413_08230 [Mucilaginibacter sp. S1162]|uniref:Uncharacterized protein n=1 Tax=Mucilaginibacter humi TaxID=2732510 RepID=A0ABX1W1N4_9SPHI|nr:hypothetical protein [Mucilaginibacter humi]NNU34137.1 hypothetical protein [Mucilaginibacter humi]